MYKELATPPERAAQDILAAILKNRPRQLIGKDAVLIDLMQRMLPTLYQRLLVRGLQRRRERMLARRGA